MLRISVASALLGLLCVAPDHYAPDRFTLMGFGAGRIN
jgi:hypothetical protein